MHELTSGVSHGESVSSKSACHNAYIAVDADVGVALANNKTARYRRKSWQHKLNPAKSLERGAHRSEHVVNVTSLQVSNTADVTQRPAYIGGPTTFQLSQELFGLFACRYERGHNGNSS